MPDWEPKVWGERKLLLKVNCVEVYLLNLEPKNGKPVCCSTHKHLMKANKFYVLSGRVAVETLDNRAIVLGPGQSCTIEPEITHRFTVLAPSTVIEMTWADSITEDIYRDDKGHVLADDEKPLNRQT